MQQDMPIVFVDRTRLQEVFVILLDNAIKFMGDQTAARIEIGCQSSETELICQVKDNGQGIDARYLEQIFGLFDRLDQTTKGSGVGLALARRIVELHRGKIWVESGGPATGSQIYITLPLGDDGNPARL